MRIATKIILGYAVLIALMAAVLFYQDFSIHQMQSINLDLSSISFRAARTSIQMIRDRDLVEEYTRKSLLLGDPDYLERLREFQEEFAISLHDMRALVRSEKEQIEVNRLEKFWGDFTQALTLELETVRSGALPDLPVTLVEHLDRLGAQVQTVHQVTLRAIEEQVGKAADTGAKAELISWSAAAIALVVSTLVSFLIVRSISDPLQHLTEGTRAIAEGKFFYRLDTTRNDEFAHLAKDFNTMSSRLNELDQMKKDFVSHVSHELKAPLASMQETIHMLLEQIPGPLSEKQKRLLGLNLQSAKRLSLMIGDLLDMSRMEAGVMEYELSSQDLVALVRLVIAECEGQAHEKHLSIEAEAPDEPFSVECDSDRIIQVLNNVLGNAVKFSPANAVLRVRVSRQGAIPEGVPQTWRKMLAESSNSNGFTVVSISDKGPGVPDEHKEKIFEKFHQVKQGKKIVGQGVGLGLAICRTIVEAHRGAIWVEDNPGGGSTFNLLLRTATSANVVTHRASSPI